MINFTDYAKIANNYCICYFGYADEYLVQLRLIKPFLQQKFPELNIYLGCKDEKVSILKDCENVIKLTELKIRKTEFAHISEIKSNGETHPIEDLLISAGITKFAINVNKSKQTDRCVIITSGYYPTKPLEKDKIDKLKRMAPRNCEINTNVSGAGLVMGVESEGLCEAASQGIETILVPTGVGTRLYKSMFPEIKLLHI